MINDLKEYATMFILGSLLFASLLYFATGFTAQNNPTALGSTGSKFDTFKGNITSTLVNTESEGNILLNISAKSDPEASLLGSSDSVATSYGISGSSGSFFDQLRSFMEWVIPGSNGAFVVAVLAGLFAFGLVYFITKWVRVGY